VTDIGPHLLGRKQPIPDERNFKLANFQGLGAVGAGMFDPAEEARLALKELQMTQITYRRWAATSYPDVKKTHWWQALNHLSNIYGVMPTPTPDQDRLWDAPFQLDQGDFPHCVGFGWAGWGNTAPVMDRFGDDDGHAIYYEAKVIEGRPGEEDGAYTQDGAKAMKARGRLTTYAYAETVEEALVHLREKGPLVIGTDWTSDMFNPDENGFVRPTGNNEGGHCYLLNGVEGDVLTFKNSWGNSFGVNGSFRMMRDDFRDLMDDYGEIIASVELPL
jgi:hypothetical protein